jgi:hypothetical protein
MPGKIFRLKSQKKFSILNGWVMQDSYLYMHVIEYDENGEGKYIFQIIDIYDSANPFGEIKTYVASLHAETLTETQS